VAESEHLGEPLLRAESLLEAVSFKKATDIKSKAQWACTGVSIGTTVSPANVTPQHNTTT